MRLFRKTKRCSERLLAFFCLVPTVLFLTGCNSSDTDQTRDAAETSFQDVDSGNSAPSVVQRDDESFRQNRQIPNSLIIGLDADMSSASAQAGLAIKRGIVLAIDEINSSGGLLGRPVELVVRDHHGNPDRGVDNIAEFGAMADVLAVVGGLHTPVALRELQTIHDHKMIYLGPWAAGTPIVENGFSPNYVFRVSVRDEYAGGFLVDCALERGLGQLGLLLERTGWGRSNELAIQNALLDRGKEKGHVEWFNLGETDLSPQLVRLDKSGVNCVLLVCNPLEGKVALEAMAAREVSKRVPIISHWGITGSNFFEMTKDLLPKIDFSFLQTCSFIRSENSDGIDRLYAAYAARFEDCDSPRDVFSPVGTAHAYEIVMMLAAAVKSADTAERSAIRNAIENLGRFEGVIRKYDPPFTSEDHDALAVDDLTLARFGENGVIEPLVLISDSSRDDEASDE